MFWNIVSFLVLLSVSSSFARFLDASTNSPVDCSTAAPCSDALDSVLKYINDADTSANVLRTCKDFTDKTCTAFDASCFKGVTQENVAKVIGKCAKISTDTSSNGDTSSSSTAESSSTKPMTAESTTPAAAPTTAEATTTPPPAPEPVSKACETTLKNSNNYTYINILKSVVADEMLSKFARCYYFSDASKVRQESVERREAKDAVKTFCGDDGVKTFQEFIDFYKKKFGCQ